MLYRNKADEILARYRRPYLHPERMGACLLFLKQQCKFTPRDHQLFYIKYTLENKNTVCTAPPRGGKTVGTEACDLYDMVCQENEDLRFYAPKYSQAKDSYSYIYNWVDKTSPLLKAFCQRRNGKIQLSSESLEFANGSNVKLYSIIGQIEGHNTTIARIEECDDWKWEWYANKVNRRLGAINTNGMPTRIRFTGTIQGEEIIHRLVTSEKDRYFNLMNHPTLGPLDVYALLELGALDPEMVAEQKANMSVDEWQRSMLLKFPDATSFFKNLYLQHSQQTMLEWGLDLIRPIEDERYDKHGRIAVGIDCGAGGQSSKSSNYAITIIEEIGNYTRPLWFEELSPNENVKDLIDHICMVIAYFNPDGGYGDALKSELIQSINYRLAEMGVNPKDPHEFPVNCESSWKEWYIQPLWNTGKAKHQFYSLVAKKLSLGEHFIPYADKKDDSPEGMAKRKFVTVHKNIRQVTNKSQYPTYEGTNPIIGDDYTDSEGMACLWLHDHQDGIIDFTRFRRGGTKTTIKRPERISVA